MTTEEQEKASRDEADQQTIRDQREANAQMVRATIEAHDLAERAARAQAQAEAAAILVQESESRYRTLFDLSPVAVYSCDASGVILQFNHNAVELWGRAPVVGDTDALFCGSHKLFRHDGSLMPHGQSPMAEVLSGRLAEVHDEEVLIERPDASRITVIVNIRPLRNQGGELTGAINCFYDITARKQVEIDLADSLKRERELAEFREKFVAIVGHDLRNPLNAIVMASGLLLRRGHLDENDGQTVARIIRSSQRMTRMISQLLDLTRARLGEGIPISRAPADLREICLEVADEFDAELELRADGDLTGSWDGDRLAEVISNITGNAIEHAAQGTAVIVEARAERDGVLVAISNQGAPIPADLLPFIFEPFRRAGKRDKPEGGNLGLGLYIARQIVLMHGGVLDVRSDAGTTSFTMRLPRQPANAARQARD